MYESSAPLDDRLGGGPGLPPAGSTNLRKAGKWGRFIGIVSMVGIGLGALTAIVFGGTLIGITGNSEFGGMMTAWLIPIVIVYGLLFALMFYLSFLLYQFGNNAIVAVETRNEDAIVTSFGSLARLLKILGIFTVIQLAFSALWFAGIFITGAFSLFQ
ncbi:hypothetical protein [Lewinella sp. IMCC34183]|uniref:hypothetical protein n=1 Tax=Lewinella sp. IMCC34183 TaxID=2248762 RepID=UPI000E272CE5|nr:hypothetical protein [Lewinella sp. IMCC34183]